MNIRAQRKTGINVSVCVRLLFEDQIVSQTVEGIHIKRLSRLQVMGLTMFSFYINGNVTHDIYLCISGQVDRVSTVLLLQLSLPHTSWYSGCTRR